MLTLALGQAVTVLETTEAAVSVVNVTAREFVFFRVK